MATAGRHSEAVRELETAHRLDPVSSIVTGDLGLIHLYAGNLEEAVEYCTRAVELEPSAVWATGCAFDALAALGDDTRARPLAEQLIAAAGESVDRVLGGESVESVPGAPSVAAVAGSAAAADDVAVQRFHDWRADRAGSALEDSASAWGAALAFAAAGRHPEALRALRRAAQERGLGFVTLTIDPRLRPLWSDPDFRALADDLVEHGFAPLAS